MARKKKEAKVAEAVEETVVTEDEGQTTFNEDDMSILYDDNGEVIECEDCLISDEVEEG